MRSSEVTKGAGWSPRVRRWWIMCAQARSAVQVSGFLCLMPLSTPGSRRDPDSAFMECH